MKTKTIIDFEFEVENEKIVGEYNEYMGHSTYIVVGGIEDIDDDCGHLSALIPERGNHIMFSIPSGDLEGSVINTYADWDNNSILHVRVYGTWDGIFGGLMGGLSCYGRFHATIQDDETIESSWGTMAYEEYMLIRDLRSSRFAHSAYISFKKIELEDREEEYKEYKEGIL